MSNKRSSRYELRNTSKRLKPAVDNVVGKELSIVGTKLAEALPTFSLAIIRLLQEFASDLRIMREFSITTRSAVDILVIDNRLYALSFDNTVGLFDATSGEFKQTIAKNVRKILRTPDKQLVCFHYKNTHGGNFPIRIHDIHKHTVIKSHTFNQWTAKPEIHIVSFVDMNSKGELVIVGDSSHGSTFMTSIYMFNIAGKQLRCIPLDDTLPIADWQRRFCATPDSRFIFHGDKVTQLHVIEDRKREPDEPMYRYIKQPVQATQADWRSSAHIAFSRTGAEMCVYHEHDSKLQLFTRATDGALWTFSRELNVPQAVKRVCYDDVGVIYTVDHHSNVIAFTV